MVLDLSTNSRRVVARERLAARGFTLIELMIVVAIIGLLAALAIPNFLKFQARAKTSEAKTELKGLFTAQKAYFGEHSQFGSDYNTIGWSPERGNRYAVWMGSGATKIDRTGGAELIGASPTEFTADTFRLGTTVCVAHGGADCVAVGAATITWQPSGSEVAGLPSPGGVEATGHTCSAFAYGDIDSDASVDAWYITNISTTLPTTAGACVLSTDGVGGAPINNFNDVDC